MSCEIEIVTKIDELYTTSSCTSAQFLLTFFSRVYGSDLYSIILSRAINEVINMIEAIGPEGFSIDPNVLSKRARMRTAGNSNKYSFDEGITYIIRATGYFIESFKAFPGLLPNSVKILLKHVYSKMVNKAWLKEIGQESTKNKLHKAMLKLLIDQLMIAFIISPEIEALCMKEIAPQKKRKNFKQCR